MSALWNSHQVLTGRQLAPAHRMTPHRMAAPLANGNCAAVWGSCPNNSTGAPSVIARPLPASAPPRPHTAPPSVFAGTLGARRNQQQAYRLTRRSIDPPPRHINPTRPAPRSVHFEPLCTSPNISPRLRRFHGAAATHATRARSRAAA